MGNVKEEIGRFPILSDCANVRAYATVMRLSVCLSSVVVCDVMYCG